MMIWSTSPIGNDDEETHDEQTVTSRLFRNFALAFGLALCLIQIMTHSLLLSSDSTYAILLSDISSSSKGPEYNHFYVQGSMDDFHLTGCRGTLPHNLTGCAAIYGSDFVLPSIPVETISVRTQLIQDDLDNNLKIRIAAIPESSGVDLHARHGTVLLDGPCAANLRYPEREIRNIRQENLNLTVLHFWLIVITLMAVLNNSVPHIYSLLIFRLSLIGWSVYSLVRSKWQDTVFRTLTTRSSCSINLFQGYFDGRIDLEIANIRLNCVGLVVACYLLKTMPNVSVSGAQTINQADVSPRTRRLYQYTIAMQACLQVEAYFVMMAMVSWFRELTTGRVELEALAGLAGTSGFLFFGTTIVTSRLISMRWFSINPQATAAMALFLLQSIALLLYWSIVFYSRGYRWAFGIFPYLTCLTATSLALILASIFLGLLCWTPFRHGHGFRQPLEDFTYAPATVDVTEKKRDYVVDHGRLG